MLKDINWERIKQEAFTSIRHQFTIESLEVINNDTDNNTPVSGDAIARIRHEHVVTKLKSGNYWLSLEYRATRPLWKLFK